MVITPLLSIYTCRSAVKNLWTADFALRLPHILMEGVVLAYMATDGNRSLALLTASIALEPGRFPSRAVFQSNWTVFACGPGLPFQKRQFLRF
jgi:hypothetical protein